MSHHCRPLHRPASEIAAELAGGEACIIELRREPEFLVPDSACSVEHARVSRRLAVLRAELAGTTGRRDPVRPTPRY